jgi:Fic family protein
MEKYLHAPSDLPPLIRLALVHYQFEAIHPFIDGNGRIGRLLVTLLLSTEGLLPQPLLYLSAYFERNREEYYQRLLAISQQGDWTAWLMFFLRGVAEQARDASARAMALLALQRQYHEKLHSMQSSALPLRLADELIANPVTTIARAGELLHVTARAAQQNIEKLEQAGIVTEVSGRHRNRIYAAHQVMQILEGEGIRE